MASALAAMRILARLAAIKPLLESLRHTAGFAGHAKVQAGSLTTLMAGVTFEPEDVARICREITLCNWPQDIEILLVDRVSNSGLANPSSRVRLQNYEAFVNYVTPSRWTRMKAATISVVLSDLIELLVLLGCSHPTERTFQLLTALYALITIGQAAILDLPSLEKARYLRFVKDSFRRRAKFAGPPTFRIESLPYQASTFMETYPSYEPVFEGEIPSMLPYDENLLKWLADSFPMRSTKVVRFGHPSAPVGDHAQMHMNPFAGGLQATMQLCLQDACMKAVSAFMRQPPEKSADDIGLKILPPDLLSRLRSGPPPLTNTPLREVAPPAGQSGDDALVEKPLGAPTLRKRRKLKKKKRHLESGCEALVPKSSPIAASILKREKGKAEERSSRVRRKKEVVKKMPAGAVAMKRPAGQVLGCSKCRYLQNGCGACRPCDYKNR